MANKPSGFKKLINEVECCVDDSLEGYVACNPGVQLLEGHRVIIRSDVSQLKEAGKVGLVSGGGSGHEPAHSGYVGPGMLTAAVAGAVFTSPPPDSILAAIRAVGHGNSGGVLLIVKNYTGDRLNFGIAAERAKNEGILVEMLVVGEDCALTTQDKTAGRRGLCGTVLIHKIAGAMAETNQSLMRILHFASAAANNMGTIGLCLSPCNLPGSGPSFHLEYDEMELGLGIHGEAGVKRIKITSASGAVDIMLNHLSNVNTGTHMDINTGDEFCLMVNNLGGTSVLELNIVCRDALKYLESQGVAISRLFCGTFMSSLDMVGVSLTLMRLTHDLKNCLDMPTLAPGWVNPLLPVTSCDRLTPLKIPAVTYTTHELKKMDGDVIKPELANLVYDAICMVCIDIIASEELLNKLDTEAGDGDCGTTHKRGAEAILKALGPASSPELPVSTPHHLIHRIAKIIEQSMGGSSGALYSLFLSAGAPALRMNDWMTALQQGISAMSKYGGAEAGDRTMLDTLLEAHSSLVKSLASSASPKETMVKLVQDTEAAAVATTRMRARAGRASYVNVDRLKQPDAGATAVSIWIKSLAKAFNASSFSNSGTF